MKDSKKAILALILVSLSYATLSVASRLLGEGFQPMSQVFMRVGIGFLLSLIIFSKKLRFSVIKTITRKDLILLLIMGTIGYSIAVYFITQGVLNTNLVNVSVIYSSIVFFSYINSIIFFKKGINIKVIIYMLISLVGIAFIASKSFKPDFTGFGIGEIYVLLSAITMSWFSTGRKMLSSRLNDQEVTSITMFIAALSSLFIALILGESISLDAFTNIQVLFGLALGAMLNVAASYLESFSWKRIDLVLGNQILLSESIFSILFGFILYQEKISLPEIVGSLIILTCVYLMNRVKQDQVDL